MNTNEMKMIEVVKDLSMELAQRDYNELADKIKGMNFETAFKTFNGYGLRADPILCGKEYIGINMFFECRYKSIKVTIFKCDDISCELGECCEVYTHNGKVCVIRMY